MLTLSQSTYVSLRQHGEETYPYECCGVLLGRFGDDGSRTVTRHWFGCSYLITSVEKGRATITNSFELTGFDEGDKKFVDEKTEVV
jgi:proteasome lid subunit RPN8/RPN11